MCMYFSKLVGAISKCYSDIAKISYANPFPNRVFISMRKELEHICISAHKATEPPSIQEVGETCILQLQHEAEHERHEVQVSIIQWCL